MLSENPAPLRQTAQIDGASANKPLRQLALALGSVAALFTAAGCKTTSPAKSEIFGHTSADQVVGSEVDRIEDCTDQCVESKKNSGASPTEVYLE